MIALSVKGYKWSTVSVKVAVQLQLLRAGAEIAHLLLRQDLGRALVSNIREQKRLLSNLMIIRVTIIVPTKIIIILILIGV